MKLDFSSEVFLEDELCLLLSYAINKIKGWSRLGTKEMRIDNHHVDRIVLLSDINRYFYHRSLLQKNFAVFSQPLYRLSSRQRADNVRVRVKKRNSSETNEVRAKLCRARKRRLGVNEKKT